MVKLRLKRYGKKRESSYRIVAIDSHARREGRPLQEVGFYNPRTKATTLETAAILTWLRKGAQPTETVRGILTKAKIFELLATGATGDVASISLPGIPKPIPVEVVLTPVVEEVAVEEPAAESAVFETVTASETPAEAVEV